jgi:Fe2+ or Zn2+ uptake regulation protein
MSQEEVYKILKELGGIATQKQIKQRAQEKFPNATLYTYVGNRLRKLRKNGYVVSYMNENHEKVWKIIEEYR